MRVSGGGEERNACVLDLRCDGFQVDKTNAELGFEEHLRFGNNMGTKLIDLGYDHVREKRKNSERLLSLKRGQPLHIGLVSIT